MKILPDALEKLIEGLSSLPGVGSRTAERYAYFLLRNDQRAATSLAESLKNLHGSISRCPVTFALINKGQEVSPLYSDPMRDKSVIAVVADTFDIVAIEKTSQYKGTYHVLGGLISPIDEMGPKQLHIAQLLERIKKDKVKELILATNASVEGESTALYLQQQVNKSAPKVKLTRLARGLPVGVDLEYADQITLGRALEGRTLL